MRIGRDYSKLREPVSDLPTATANFNKHPNYTSATDLAALIKPETAVPIMEKVSGTLAQYPSKDLSLGLAAAAPEKYKEQILPGQISNFTEHKDAHASTLCKLLKQHSDWGPFMMENISPRALASVGMQGRPLVAELAAAYPEQYKEKFLSANIDRFCQYYSHIDNPHSRSKALAQDAVEALETLVDQHPGWAQDIVSGIKNNKNKVPGILARAPNLQDKLDLATGKSTAVRTYHKIRTAFTLGR